MGGNTRLGGGGKSWGLAPATGLRLPALGPSLVSGPQTTIGEGASVGFPLEQGLAIELPIGCHQKATAEGVAGQDS